MDAKKKGGYRHVPFFAAKHLGTWNLSVNGPAGPNRNVETPGPGTKKQENPMGKNSDDILPLIEWYYSYV